MGNVATFLFFFLTYVATAMWFHWLGVYLGIAMCLCVSLAIGHGFELYGHSSRHQRTSEQTTMNLFLATFIVGVLPWAVYEYF